MTRSLALIVLASTKLGERQLVLHTLSREYGRRSFVAGVPKSGALFLPLSVLDVSLVQNPKSDLWRVKDPVALYPLNNLRSSMTKNVIALFMSEVLYRTLVDGSYEDGLYEWALGSIRELDSLQDHISDYPIKFMLEFCGALGFKAAPRELAPYIGDDYMVPGNGERRTQMMESILKYLSVHLDMKINIRSLGVLHEVCSDFVTLPR